MNTGYEHSCVFNYGYYQSSKSLIFDLEIESLIVFKSGRAVVQSCNQAPMPRLKFVLVGTDDLDQQLSNPKNNLSGTVKLELLSKLKNL
ncbi:hypothetical protein WN944_014491 [Citrus x changshan-huyou]|uniref:Uncharacterized protein n=1 Tax=Citrus x changshan-huyou TaxID=2935761 RepID=A0AAP0M7Z0_9ROSI